LYADSNVPEVGATYEYSLPPELQLEWKKVLNSWVVSVGYSLRSNTTIAGGFKCYCSSPWDDGPKWQNYFHHHHHQQLISQVTNPYTISSTNIFSDGF
jgi:hypothetical protein